MSDRYEQPERGSYTDRWDIVLNRNFARIGDDVDRLLKEKADQDGGGAAELRNYASIGANDARTKSHPVTDVTHPSNGVSADGTDQTATFQSIVDTIDSEEIILIPPGDYQLDGEVLFNGISDLYLVGYGAHFTFTDNLAGFTFENCSNITVAGLSAAYDVVHNPSDCSVVKFGMRTSNATVTDITTSNLNVACRSASSVLVANSTLVGNGADGATDGVQILGSDDVRVANNHIANWYEDGIKVSQFGEGRGEGTVIAGNVIADCGDDGIDLYADGHEVTITGNHIRDFVFAGVKIMGHDSGEDVGWVDDVTVTGNVIDTGEMGILVKQSGLSTISSNTIRNMTDECILVNNTAGVSTANTTLITENILADSTSGVNIQDTPIGVVTIDSNIIKGHEWRGINDGSEGATNIIITSNYISDSGGHGVEIRNPATIAHNVFDGITSDHYYFHSASDALITGEVLNANVTTGLTNTANGSFWYDDAQGQLRARVRGQTVSIDTTAV